MTTLLDNAKTLFDPHYWSMNLRYSETFEKLCSFICDNADNIKFVGYNNTNTILCLDHTLFECWTANYPYAFLQRVIVYQYDGDPDKIDSDSLNDECCHLQFRIDQGRPSRATIKRFYKLFRSIEVIEQLVKQKQKQQDADNVNKLIDNFNQFVAK